MKGRKIKEKEGSAIVMYIRSTSDITQNGRICEIRISIQIGKDMRSIANITKSFKICGLEEVLK